MTLHQRTILVGIDGSHPSGAALRWAAEEAAAGGGRLRVVYAWVPAPLVPLAYGFAPDVLPTAAAGEAEIGPPGGVNAESVGRRVLEALTASGHADLEVDVRVRQGHAAQVLLDESADVDLIVVGRRGVGGFAAAVMGSISRYVSAHARCPVVVVPHDDERRTRA